MKYQGHTVELSAEVYQQEHDGPLVHVVMGHEPGDGQVYVCEQGVDIEAEPARVHRAFQDDLKVYAVFGGLPSRRMGRPRLTDEARLIPVPVRLTPAQRDKLKDIGVSRLREWLDAQ